jgi:short-subunit dehydrogenase
MKRETVLITGASSGIGLELAKIFATEKYDLVLVARDANKLNEIAKELTEKFGSRVTVLSKDLNHPSSPKEIFEKLQKQQMNVSILVNNAGFGLFGKFTETDWAQESQMIQVNIHALTSLTKLFIPSMIEHGRGKILNVASTAAFQPGPLMAVYYATKAYVLSFSEALAEELEEDGISVTALCPGPTKSGFQKMAKMEKSRLVRGKIDTAESVAQQGFNGLMRGKRVIVTGCMNKIMASSVRFMPRRAVTKLVKAAQKSN